MNRIQIECNLCGKTEIIAVQFVYEARMILSARGWKSRQAKLAISPLVRDFCPTCIDPATQ